MHTPLTLEKYSLGVGDRFARQAPAQLRACLAAAHKGIDVIPVWNKSNREHVIIGSEPGATRAAADAAVKALGWTRPHHVDADHIGLGTVSRFIPHADFFTIDVADWIGKPAPADAIAAFIARHSELVGKIAIPGFETPFDIDAAQVRRMASKYLLAVQEAGKVYRHVATVKGEGKFITEVSLDETDSAQTPPEMLMILAALADEAIPVQTIAPKFTGRFNKGVDYVGDVDGFEREFNEDLAVIGYAVRQYPLPTTLKLSVHSGSDKFSLYGPMARALARTGAGLHLKTAGTTWLEEVIGLAEAGGRGLALAKEIYVGALAQADELCAPYATVIDIDHSKLPSAAEVRNWSAEQFVAALRHDQQVVGQASRLSGAGPPQCGRDAPATGETPAPLRNPAYNPHLRQLIHVGYKIAAQMGARYLDALDSCQATVSRNVTENLYERHIRPLFLS